MLHNYIFIQNEEDIRMRQTFFGPKKQKLEETGLGFLINSKIIALLIILHLKSSYRKRLWQQIESNLTTLNLITSKRKR